MTAISDDFCQDESETPRALYTIRAEASGAVSPSIGQKALKVRVGILRITSTL